MADDQDPSLHSLPASPVAKRVKITPTALQDPRAASMAAAVTSVSQDIVPPLHVKRSHEKAKIPTRGSAFAAGYDLYAYVVMPC